MTDNEIETIDKKDKQLTKQIALVEFSLQKLDRWAEQVNSKNKIQISRKELLNWWLERSPENLSNSEINAVVDKFYDEEALLSRLLRDVKKAKKLGNTKPTLDVVVKPKRLDQAKRDLNLDAEDESDSNL